MTAENNNNALVGVVMGSSSDWAVTQEACKMLSQLGIRYEYNVTSAHRAPDRLAEYCRTAEQRGLKALICACGGAAHLPGVVASQTSLPVLGCPLQGWSLNGLDSLLSMVQMPRGVPVATFSIGEPGTVNAALFAGAILALSDETIRANLLEYRKQQADRVDVLPQDV